MRWSFYAALLAVVLGFAAPTYSQSYPTKPIRMIVASSPGTASDFFARTIGQALTEIYKVQVVIDNRTGAGGLIGNSLVSKASPDGYTIGMIGATRIVSALIRKDAPYDPIRDTTPIMQVTSIPNVLVVTPSLGVTTVQELVNAARSRPGQLNFASVGLGSSSHLAAEIFARAAGIQAVHVPFKALADSFTEMLAGRVHFYVYTMPSTLGVIRDGKLRALALTSSKRNGALPQVPTMAEAGIPAAQFDNWSAIIAPPRTAERIVTRLHADIARVLGSADINEKFSRQGAEALAQSGPAALKKLLAAEHDRYAKLVEDGTLKPQ